MNRSRFSRWRRSVIKKVPQSIFLKLLLVFVGTGILMVALVMGILSHISHVHDRTWLTRNHNRLFYASLLADRIGTPPDKTKAVQIAEQTGMQIRIETKGQSVFSTPHAPTLDDVSKTARRCLWEPMGKVAIWQGRVYSSITRGGYEYLFSYEIENILDARPEWGALIIALVLLALALNYIVIRWLFRPVEWLSEGVQRVRNGQLDFQIRTRENDELGELTKSFNQMTRRISGMIKAKEQLLLDVSHELRSPITRIKVALELDDQAFKDQIKKNLRVLEAMIAELLESARLDTPQGGLRRAPVAVDQLVKRVVCQFKDEKPGVVVAPISPQLKANLDFMRAETVLKNLVENALKYSLHQDRPVEVAVDSHNDTQNLRVQIRDYGPGIPEKEQDLVFEPFYRLDKARVRETGGYGLGLALCKKIMLAHQGDIQVSSSPLTGTVFTLVFPAA